MSRIPTVRDGQLHGAGIDGVAGLAVGSPGWFSWLASEAARSFSFRSSVGSYTARKERRQRGGAYWVAYRTAGGHQYKSYLGRSDELTSGRLAEVATTLAAHVVGGGVSIDPRSATTPPAGRLQSNTRPVLTAKLLVAPPRPGTVVRPRLHERLRATAGRRLTTVVAPAGWGKTTLLTSWAHDSDEHRPIGWFSIDETDDEPARFWTYALSALDRVAPRLTRQALAALGGPGLDPLNVALAAFLNELAATAKEHVLVLDDYHLLADRAIHESVEFLLAYLPPSLHLIIASRMDLPLPLARMRASESLTEIRIDELKCTADEGAALITVVADVGTPTTDELVRRTEGWPAGLRLAALTLRDARDPIAAAATIRGDTRHILDYFDAEVLTGLEAGPRDLLVRCSVLERLCGALCDAVLDTHGSAAVLEMLDREGRFVAAVGDAWFRCHPLFRDALRRELDRTGPDQISTLLIRAADWFQEQDQIEEAVTHRLAAGDDVGAFILLSGNAPWFLDRGAMSALLRLGERCASSVRDPRLYLMLAAAAIHCGQQEHTLAWLEAAEPLLTDELEPPPGWSSVRALADTTWATYGAFDDPEGALRHARRAVQLEDDPTRWGYAVARLALAGALWGAGLVPESIEVLRSCQNSPVYGVLPTMLRLQSAGLLAFNLVEVGELDEARRVCAEFAASAAAAERTWGGGAAAAVAILRHAEGRLLAATNPAAALPALQHAVALAEDWGRPLGILGTLTSLAGAQWATGDRAGARISIDRARDAAEEMQQHFAIQRLRDLEARVGRSAITSARRQGALVEELTDRELDVLRALRSPLSAREIGAELYLSINTVKGYTKALYRKLGVAARADAVQRGYELGLI